MSTRYKRQNIIKLQQNYVAPIEKCIGTRFELNSQNGEPTQIKKPTTFQYVPLKDTIKSLFSNENFRTYFFNNKEHLYESGKLVNYCCAQNIKNNDLYQSRENLLFL